MIGETVSHYKILEKLGSGGMGVLYKAEDTNLQRIVALKFLPAAMTRDAEAKKLFVQEARTASTFDHPNICTIYEIDETESGQLYIVMPCYSGRTLREHMDLAMPRGHGNSYSRAAETDPGRKTAAKDAAFPSGLRETEILDIALQIAHGLSKAHSKGIVHRDIKPDNIFITEDGIVKILDFGLVKLAGKSSSEASPGFGTVAYMAPEEIGYAPTDPRCDIWSLGVIMYQMVSGRLPFSGSMDYAIMYNIVNAEPEPIERIAPGVSPALGRIISRCLSKNVDDRWPSVPSLVEALQAAGMKRSTPSPATPYMLAAIGIILFMVVSALGFTLWNRWFYADGHLPKTALVVGLVHNQTNDQQLNTFAGLLSSTLEKSRSLTVIPPTEVQEYLIRHKKDPNAFCEKIGRAVCRETEASLLLLPSVSRSDSDIVLQCRLQSINSDSSWTFKKIISSRDSIYVATDLIADAIRLKARESQLDVRRNPSNTVQATSPNLEAYQFYNYGELELKKVKLVQARGYFQHAVELDSTFGQAYYQLANIALWMDDDPISSHTLFQAASRYNIPDRQRYLLKANMAAIEKGSHDGLQVLQSMEKRFQDEREVQYLLASWFYDLGQYHKAIPILEQLLQKDPAYEMPYDRLIEGYKQVHREDLAEKMRAEYARHNPNASLRLRAWEKFYTGDPEGARQIFMEDLNRDAISPDGLMGLVRTSYALNDSALLLDAVNRFGHAGYNRLWFELINSSLAAFGSSSGNHALYKNWLSKYKGKEQPLAISYAELLMYEDRYDQAERVLKPWCTAEKLSSFRLITLEELLYVYLYQGRYQKAKELVQDMVQWCKTNTLAAHQGRYLIMQRFLYDWSEQAPPGIAALDAKIDSLAPSISSSVYWRPYYYYCLLKQEPAKAEKILSDHLPASKLFSYRQLITAAWQDNGPQATAIDSLMHPNRPYHFDIKPIPVIVYYHLAKRAFLREDWPAAERYARLVISTYQNNFGLRAVFYHKSLILLARIAEHQGRLEEARRYYKKVLTLWARADDNLPDLQWARQKINTIPGR